MPLEDLRLPLNSANLPGDVRSFLREAERRIRRFQRHRHIPAFVASDFAGAYRVLSTLAAAELVDGNLFCEWGSGFGVVACLAAMLDYDAWGIEIEDELVEAAQQLADDFSLPAQFHYGSFIPMGSENTFPADHHFSWLTTEMSSAQEEMELAPADFAVIFAYPWPDEEEVIEGLFELHGGTGAILVTYRGTEDFQLRRKVTDG